MVEISNWLCGWDCLPPDSGPWQVCNGSLNWVGQVSMCHKSHHHNCHQRWVLYSGSPSVICKDEERCHSVRVQANSCRAILYIGVPQSWICSTPNSLNSLPQKHQFCVYSSNTCPSCGRNRYSPIPYSGFNLTKLLDQSEQAHFHSKGLFWRERDNSSVQICSERHSSHYCSPVRDKWNHINPDLEEGFKCSIPLLFS